MACFALKARFVFPVEGPPLADGLVTIDGGRIASVGENTSGRAPLDLGSVALLPGLVNAHTHLEFSDLAQPLGEPGMPLPQWIHHVIAARAAGQRNPHEAIAAGLRESLAAGTTTLADITTLDPGDYPASATAPLEVTALVEMIAFSTPRAQSAFGPIEQMVDAAIAADRLAVGVSPHAPYTVHPELVTRLANFSAARQVPLAMHLGESREEEQLLRTGDGPFRELLDERSMWDPTAIPAGTTWADYLRRLRLAHRALVVHGNYFAEEELRLLAADRDSMSLVYCPRTHAYFQHEPYPLADALALGVNVALGTDSRASNPDLSLLEEMRFVARKHADVPPDTALRMGTLAAAEALGRRADVGSLRPGKLANLAAVAIPEQAQGEPHELLLGGSGPVVRTWYRGAEVRGA